MLLEAEKPVIAVGDGVYWSKAADELREMVELLQIPVYTTKLGEGAVSEYHPLSIHRLNRSKMTRQADVVLALGVRFWRGEGYGNEPAVWNPNLRMIQVDANPSKIGLNVSPEVGIVGDPRAVLQQMLECAQEKLKSRTYQNRAQ